MPHFQYESFDISGSAVLWYERDKCTKCLTVKSESPFSWHLCFRQDGLICISRLAKWTKAPIQSLLLLLYCSSKLHWFLDKMVKNLWILLCQVGLMMVSKSENLLNALHVNKIIRKIFLLLYSFQNCTQTSKKSQEKFVKLLDSLDFPREITMCYSNFTSFYFHWFIDEIREKINFLVFEYVPIIINWYFMIFESGLLWVLFKRPWHLCC